MYDLVSRVTEAMRVPRAAVDHQDWGTKVIRYG